LSATLKDQRSCFTSEEYNPSFFLFGVNFLSNELLILLKRTQKPQPKYREPSSEPSPALLALLGRMEARAWKEETLARTVEYIKESANEIKLIQHLRSCKECQLEASISIERYGGRCLPWFLDLINDPFECGDPEWIQNHPFWKDCPRAQDYAIGSYWDKSTKHNETWKFISDRINWAEKIIRQQIAMATQFYKRLNAWDLTGLPPSEETLPF